MAIFIQWFMYGYKPFINGIGLKPNQLICRGELRTNSQMQKESQMNYNKIL